LRQAQHALLQAAQDRTELLKTVTTVANQLLRSTDYTAVIADVLQSLGEAANADRCGLVQNVTDPQSGRAAVQIHTEWCRADIQALIAHTPNLESALLWEYFPDFNEKLAQGEVVHFFVNELPEPARQLLRAQGNIAMTIVPIMVQGEFWGVFGFDYCQESYLYDEANTPIFAIAVDSIAAVIERQTQVQAIREAERNQQAAIVEERNRMAREIHDTVAQALTGIVVHLESTEHILTTQPETARRRLDLVRQLARETLIEARQSIQALRPQALVSQQLPAAIATLIEHLPQDSLLAAEFSLHGAPCLLPSMTETNLLRIAQEALANVVKHAQASRVQISLTYEAEEICLSVQDNGQGFDLDSITGRATSDSACFGLLIMQERAEMFAGQLTIRSDVGQGTTVRVTIP